MEGTAFPVSHSIDRTGEKLDSGGATPMSEPTPGSRGGATEGEAWLTVLDGLVGGIHHALNNRTAALAAVAQVLEGEIPSGSALRGLFTQEMERLRATVGLLAAIPRSRVARSEPVQVTDLIPDLRSLFGLHHDLRDTGLSVEEASGVLPVWTDPVDLTHALMVLLAAAGRDARVRGGASVRMQVEGDEEWVRVRIGAVGGGGERGDGGEEAGAGQLAAVRAEAVAEWLAAAEGRLEVGEGEGGLPVYLAELPSLLAIRRRG